MLCQLQSWMRCSRRTDVVSCVTKMREGARHLMEVATHFFGAQTLDAARPA